MTDSVVIYCDGASSGNPGPSGWGAVLFFPNGHVKEIGGGVSHATNNQMELQAAISSLAQLKDQHHSILVCTDSSYLISGITAWVHGWKKNGWKTKEGNEVSNRLLWEKLYELSRKLPKLSWQHVRGHAGVPGNDRADAIAVSFRDGLEMDLYDGPFHKYDYVQEVLPPKNPPLVPKKKKKSSPGGYYLSLLGNSLERHQTWTACEARVKGQSGAKFKKVASDVEESEILKKWGV